ncbi:amino acid permease [Picrophilus oshimae]|uniref:Amino acid permease n=1 Tax=Picrophilus torridus (strain ATCC 700027 / DSM 9790 / JCM 10055 / NBRC 100828 / KAW 2/3) TaxID=1122961 RepID=Q6KZJ8_PICTO|nr:CBS domain-containing protein [Picrophilus oshimae]AAT43854.1 amino acid permease [Picrophilus oshimae DSM 9789]
MGGNAKGELKRTLSFKDLFFLSFGGMSPLLSILSYGAFAITLAGYDAPLVMIIGTLLVLINGVAVTQLSKRFTSSGGYYTYAFQTLSERLGFDTGWVYIFYSTLFGLAYLSGSVFIISTVFRINPYLVFAILMIPSIIFLMLGVKLSSKYALYAVAIEVSFMIAIVVYSLFLTHGRVYLPNPGIYHIGAGDFFLGILFAMGIPTGYGSITPVSGEVKDAKKTVGRSVIAVILGGGILATVMVYAISNLILQNHIIIPVNYQLPVIEILKNNFSRYGYIFYYGAAIATINDGILALLSFGAATSRTLFRMGYDKSFPSFFSFRIKDNPVIATAFTSIIFILIPLAMFHFISAEITFIVLGTISSLAGLFIHLITDSSLIRIGLRRGRRLIMRGVNSFFSYFKYFDEFILAITGALISAVVLIYSAYSTVPYYTTIFLTWIVIGFILSEVKSIVTKTPYMPDVSKEGKIVAENLLKVSVGDALIPGNSCILRLSDTLKSAMEKMISKNVSAAIVVDSYSRAIGTLYLVDILLLPQYEIDNGKVYHMKIYKPVNINVNDDITDAVRLLKENTVPVLSVTDDSGKCIGMITERDVLLRIGSVQKPALD